MLDKFDIEPFKKDKPPKDNSLKTMSEIKKLVNIPEDKSFVNKNGKSQKESEHIKEFRRNCVLYTNRYDSKSFAEKAITKRILRNQPVRIKRNEGRFQELRTIQVIQRCCNFSRNIK